MVPTKGFHRISVIEKAEKRYLRLLILMKSAFNWQVLVLPLKTFISLCLLQLFLKITLWKAVKPRNGVPGPPVRWLVAKEFQWGPEVSYRQTRPKCWDVTCKWSKRKCAQPPFHSVKVIKNNQTAELTHNNRFHFEQSTIHTLLQNSWLFNKEMTFKQQLTSNKLPT